MLSTKKFIKTIAINKKIPKRSIFIKNCIHTDDIYKLLSNNLNLFLADPHGR